MDQRDPYSFFETFDEDDFDEVDEEEDEEIDPLDILDEAVYVEERPLDKIEFTLYAQDEIPQNFIPITRYTKNTPSSRGVRSDWEGTVLDPRLGYLNDMACQTCNRGTSCPGHMGYIALKTLIIHPLFVDTVVKILSCVVPGGPNIGKPLLSREELEPYQSMHVDERLTTLAKLSEKRVDPYPIILDTGDVGGKMTHVYVMASTKPKSGLIYYIESSKKPTKKDRTSNTGDVFPITTIDNIFRAITPETASLLGFGITQPKDMILRYIVVTSLCARPFKFQNKKEKPHQHTTLYNKILKANDSITESMSSTDLQNVSDEIFAAYSEIITKDVAKVDDQSVSAMLGSKTGIVRGNLEVARVNWAGRAVITPNPTLAIDEASIPEVMRSSLTVPVEVDPENIEYVKELSRKGEITHIQRRGRREAWSPNQSIEHGDTVHRWLQVGDYVILNRNPSVHRVSVLGFKVRFHKGNTIQLNLATTVPFAGDFDGDEVNIHSVQSKEARWEVENLLCISKNIMSQQTSKSAVGLIYDYPIAAFKLTKDDQMVSKEVFLKCIEFIQGDEDLLTLEDRLKEKGLGEREGQYPGKALFSALLPEGLFYKKGEVVVEDGILVQGRITKNDIGATGNNLIHTIYTVFGEPRAAQFLSQTPWVLTEWFNGIGFSIGLADCIIMNDDERRQLIGSAWRDTLTRIEELNESDIFYESKLLKILGGPEHIFDKLVSSKVDPDDNAMEAARVSGSKGSKLNLAQISGALGQQIIGGGRPRATMGGRCLPWFAPGDTNPIALGYCPSSFGSGLQPGEFVYHAEGTREGVLNTSNTTAPIGYTANILRSLMRDAVVYEDGAVKTPQGDIIQFIYGDDGVSPEYLSEVFLDARSIEDFQGLLEPERTFAGHVDFFDMLDPIIARLNHRHEKKMKKKKT